jgi:hypothetical protein
MKIGGYGVAGMIVDLQISVIPYIVLDDSHL